MLVVEMGTNQRQVPLAEPALCILLEEDTGRQYAQCGGERLDQGSSTGDQARWRKCFTLHSLTIPIRTGYKHVIVLQGSQQVWW